MNTLANIFLTAIIVLTPIQAFARDSLYALIISDTKSNLRIPLQNDLVLLKDLLGVIEQEANLDIDTEIISEQNVSTHYLLETISKAKKRPYDIVMAYYSGHGVQNQQTYSSWPCLFFSIKREVLTAETLWQSIEQLHPRLTLLFLDCCNSPAPFMFQSPLSMMAGGPISSLSFPGLSRLFNETEGIVILTAASPGEFAYAYAEGSLFSTSLFKAIYSSSVSPNAKWQEVVSYVQGQCRPLQHPIAYVETKVIDSTKTMKARAAMSQDKQLMSRESRE